MVTVDMVMMSQASNVLASIPGPHRHRDLRQSERGLYPAVVDPVAMRVGRRLESRLLMRTKISDHFGT